MFAGATMMTLYFVAVIIMFKGLKKLNPTYLVRNFFGALFWPFTIFVNVIDEALGSIEPRENIQHIEIKDSVVEGDVNQSMDDEPLVAGESPLAAPLSNRRCG